MITIVQGLGVGSGKSYYAALQIFEKLVVGGFVWLSSNMRYLFEGASKIARERHGVELQPEQVTTFPAEELEMVQKRIPLGTADCPVLLVLDEAQLELDARGWADRGRISFFQWLTRSRHDDVDVMVVTQHKGNIDRQIQRLVTYVENVRNMANFSILGFGSWRKNCFRVTRYDQDGTTKLKGWYIKKDPGIYDTYESKALRAKNREDVEQKQRLKLNKSKGITRPMKRLVIIVAVAAIFALIYLFVKMPKFWKSLKGEKEKPVPVEVAEKKLGAVPVPVAPKVGPLIEMEEFRGGDGRRFLHTDKENYEVGHASSRGIVLKVGPRTVYIDGWDGKRHFVAVRDRDTIPGEAKPRFAEPAATPPAKLLAVATPHPTLTPPPKSVARGRANGSGIPR